MEDNQADYKHITTTIGANPLNFDLAITSVNKSGTSGFLNDYVLKSYGYGSSILKQIDLSKGFYLLEREKYKPILFIVTIDKGYSGINLKKNLTLALDRHKAFLEGKKIWVPLMATGSGGMSFVDSYNTTISVLKNYPTINFTISVPDDNRGKEFINQFRADNLSGKEFSSAFKFRIQEILNREYTIGLEQDLSLSLGNKKYTFDLADLNNLSFVEFKTQKSAIDRANLRKDINSLVSRLSQISPNKKSRLIIVINGSLTDNDRAFYDTNLRLLKNERVIIYDKEDIEKLFNKHNFENTKSPITSEAEIVFNEEYQINQFLRDILNQEYNLNLEIEKSSIRNGLSIKLHLSDEEAKSYAKILNKDDIIREFRERGITYDSIKSKIVFDLITELGILNTNNTLNKYFVFLDNSFDNDDIQFMMKTLSDYNKLQILSQSEISTLANRHQIKWVDYINIENSDSNIDIDSEESTLNDKIPFHLDNVETIDRLNRELVAKSLARLINNEIFSNTELNHSFMIHLQGEWGSGKSTFLNLLENNLDNDSNKWIVIKYNAWQNQHILPPWWSFIDQIYRQAKTKFSWWYNRPGLKLRESLRRIIWYSGWHKIMTLVISIIFIGLLLAYGKSMITVVSELPSTNNIDNKTKGLTLDVFAKLIISIGSVIGLIYSLSKFLSTPFLMKSSGEAKSFMLRASDPMNRIKVHFNDLISDINNQGYQIAVFIDDIDRCNKAYTVSLLEGIQTLFKEKKVLYVVAGDKNWISTCFENNYKDFATNISRNNENLGDLFLEKAFQLSVRMPNVSERTKEKYWHHILGIEASENEKKSELNETQKAEVKQRISDNIKHGNLSNPELLKNIEEEFNVNEEVVSDIAIETFDEKQEDIKHLFINHYALINPNPRAIKRLANNYTMYRNTLLAERKDFDSNKLFRWLILDDMYPIFSKRLLKLETEKEIEESIKEMKLNKEATDKLRILLFDTDNKHGGKIEINDIKDILGL